MAYDGTYLYVNDGANFGTNTIYKIDPATGAVLASGNPGTSPLTGLAYLGGSLYGADLYGDVWKIDPTTFSSTFLYYNPSFYPMTGLTGDADNGMLYGVNQFHQFMEIDPTSGAIVASATDNSGGLYEQDIAYSGGQLFVSDVNLPDFEGGTNVIDVYDAGTFAYLRTMPVAMYGFASGLAGGTGAPSQDWYWFQANAGRFAEHQPESAWRQYRLPVAEFPERRSRGVRSRTGPWSASSTSLAAAVIQVRSACPPA